MPERRILGIKRKKPGIGRKKVFPKRVANFFAKVKQKLKKAGVVLILVPSLIVATPSELKASELGLAEWARKARKEMIESPYYQSGKEVERLKRIGERKGKRVKKTREEKMAEKEYIDFVKRATVHEKKYWKFRFIRKDVLVRLNSLYNRYKAYITAHPRFNEFVKLSISLEPKVKVFLESVEEGIDPNTAFNRAFYKYDPEKRTYEWDWDAVEKFETMMEIVDEMWDGLPEEFQKEVNQLMEKPAGEVAAIILSVMYEQTMFDRAYEKQVSKLKELTSNVSQFLDKTIKREKEIVESVKRGAKKVGEATYEGAKTALPYAVGFGAFLAVLYALGLRRKRRLQMKGAKGKGKRAKP